MGKFRTKRIFENPDSSDGLRVLVDRIWPRGMTKEKAQLNGLDEGDRPQCRIAHVVPAYT